MRPGQALEKCNKSTLTKELYKNTHRKQKEKAKKKTHDETCKRQQTAGNGCNNMFLHFSR